MEFTNVKTEPQGHTEGFLVCEHGSGLLSWEGGQATNEMLFRGKLLCGEITVIITVVGVPVYGNWNHQCTDTENCCLLDFLQELGIEPDPEKAN